ncbi:hypothetical protein [Methyloradius palustris]|uniref:Uncharacterized protein n=1 Tax=Methyloradius palustris TaxID=2778876 RepID=A0A8D5FXX9_9PROT|nr:hypothetical protein [Methyloradius palustris]BCM24169.1 hypothetical protein ZMTM_04280 [Methyloradius palustris]
MRTLFILMGCLVSLSAWADDDAGLGYSSGLSGDVPNTATVLPAPGSRPSVPNGVRIYVPPKNLEPRTLVVPLPNEKSPVVIYRSDSVETVPSLYPPLPQNSVAKPEPKKKKGSKLKAEDAETEAPANPYILKTKPLEPIISQ